MKLKCIYSDLMDFSVGQVYEGEDLGYGGVIVNGYYVDEDWDGALTIDGYDTEFTVVK